MAAPSGSVDSGTSPDLLTGAPRPWFRRVAAVAAGALAGGTAAWLVEAQVLRGLPALAVMVVAGLAVPTSRELARRVLIAGCVFLGWVPVTWWWRLPVGGVGHFGVILGVVIGVLVGWVVWRSTLDRVRLLWPRLRGTDAVLAAAAAGALWIYQPGLQSVSAAGELTRFFAGWDNVAHYNMTEMIRRFGVMVIHAPTGALGEWTYGPYPQGFHAVAATVMEGLAGVGAADVATDLVAYGRAMTIVLVGALVTVVAGICSLPALRRRPLLALPIATFAVVTFGLGPGGLLVHDGFPNFYLAVAMLCCLPLIGLQMSKPGSVGLLVAMVGAVLGVAHNWSLLLVMGVFGAGVALLPLRRSRWPRLWSEWARALVPVVAGLLWLGVAWSMLRQNPPLSDILQIPGGITQVPFSVFVLTGALALAACGLGLAHLRNPRGAAHRDDVLRLGALGCVPLVGLVVSGLIAWAQIRQSGDVGYYFWKFAIATQIVSAIVLCCAVAVLAPGFGVRRGWSTRRVGTSAVAAVVSVALTAGVAQAYGTPHKFPSSIGGVIAPGISARADFLAIGAAPLPEAATLVAAARADDGRAVPVVYAVPSSSPRVAWFLLSQWYYALTGRWTVTDDALMRTVKTPAQMTDADFAALVRDAVLNEPEAVVVVPPGSADGVRRLLEPDGLSDRVLSW
ncbi:MAG: hypothetical protein BGO37_03780 [Cellulomonas sp. 73-92]|nr:MAG: hypothetical protein BGO37_03780 [Cellulomonas sp. 73-92]